MKLTLSLLPLLLLTGCGISSKAPQSLILTAREVGGKPEWKIEQEQVDPYIYTLKTGQHAEPAFLTALKKCPVRQGTSTAALARELFVGMRDIVIRRQEHLKRYDNPLLFSLIEARLDSLPITLATYSEKENQCVTDVVMWSESGADNQLWSFLAEAPPDQLNALHQSFEVQR